MKAVKKMLFCAFIFCSFSLTARSNTFCLCDKFKNSRPGDYIVTEQDKNYSLLFVNSKNENSIVFEEINIPQENLNPKKKSWQEFLNEKAPNSTSWILFEMSLTNGEIIECYSLSQRSWISFEDGEHFLSNFFSLPLSETAAEERRKIGPPPLDQGDDRRAFWNPPLFVHGKRKEKPKFDVRKSRWANDGTLLANCTVEMFFNADDATYPFPIWIEVNNGHYGFKLKAYDTGHGLASSYNRPIPKRPPLVAGTFSGYKDSIELPIKCPSYAKDFSLEAVDASNPTLRTPIEHTLVKTDKKELYIIKLDKAKISKMLQKGHRYRLSMIPKGQQTFFIETQEHFLIP